MYDFDYYRAESIEQARELLAANREARLLAGGMTLLPAMKMRLAAPPAIVDIGHLQDLKGVCVDGDAVVIGALTTHAEVADSEVLRTVFPALADVAAHIGDAQVRNCGTLGGSLANNDPSADYPAAVLALNAVIRTSHRDIAADEFFTGMFETVLAADEIILSVRFPLPLFAAYVKFPNPASRYAIVGVMVAKHSSGVRVAVTGAGACVFRAHDIEALLDQKFDENVLQDFAFAADDLNDDMHASAEYRAHLVVVMARRATAAARR